MASQEKAAAAQAAGCFVDEIVPVPVRSVKVIQSWWQRMSTLKLGQPLKINSPSSAFVRDGSGTVTAEMLQELMTVQQLSFS
ncbi:hypothetical protein [Streptococcus equi]|uniref:hypothetical protein n=1 Tax=Streptococcus equi TaxID=1336 RepID=UPI001E376120|nr:hypothetical protein [Streptococcus equi]